MEDQSNFRTQTFQSFGQQYLYQLHSKANNSILKIYDSRTKLRSTQQIKLPANYKIYTCQQFLILLNQKDILLYQFPNTTSYRQCQNPGIKEIYHCCFNLQVNLILLIDESNILWYLMPELNCITIHKLLKLSDRGIKGKIRKLALDNDSVVHILCRQSQVLHHLEFQWNQHDKLDKQTKDDKVVAFYSRFQWKAIIFVVDGDPQSYKIEINYGDKNFENTLEKFDAEKCLLIKTTRQDFIYLDEQEKDLVIVNKGEQIRYREFDTFFPNQAAPNNLLFQIKKISCNTIKLSLHFFEGLKEKQPFNTIEIPIKWFQINEEKTFYYIYNNIHFIFQETGISPHFVSKVLKYMDISEEDDTEGDQKLACIFLQKLFKDQPLTVARLAESLTGDQHPMNFRAKLLRFLPYIHYTLNQVTEYLQKFAFLDPLTEETDFQQIKNQYQKQLENVISFLGKLIFSLHTHKIQQIMKNNEMEEQNEEESLRFSDYLDKAKTLYIVNLIVYEQHCRNISKKNNCSSSSIIRESSNDENQNKMYEHKLKIGEQTCHQFFQKSLKAQMNFKDIFQYLIHCSDFLQAAYFYLLTDKTKISIPFINDHETIQLIKFLVMNPTQKVLSNRQQFREVTRTLPQVTSKALLINQPEYLQYICSLSINCQEIRCCLAILLSGVTKTWSCRQFVVHAFVLCNRASAAYDLLVSYTENQEEREKLFQSFVIFCISSKKVKDLFQLNNLSEADEKCVKEKLTNAFNGDDAEQIAELMSQLKSQNEQS